MEREGAKEAESRTWRGRYFASSCLVTIEVFLESQHHLFLQPFLQVMLVLGLLVLFSFCVGK